ncbi:hypothetical protein [Conexibacter sp. SYSU D00693]|uniref:hypothetical protein n=1 Tax=Conexibacter sp. SYSU D00693 TaxID=2812560 RepID=UPI00196B6574|nr:hypothetical protein [Conexibacter sp. SYSU D00693]
MRLVLEAACLPAVWQPCAPADPPAEGDRLGRLRETADRIQGRVEQVRGRLDRLEALPDDGWSAATEAHHDRLCAALALHEAALQRIDAHRARVVARTAAPSFRVVAV